MKPRLTYANVMATVAVFIALGGSAYAFHLGKNSVGSKQLKKNAVSTAKIKKEAVTAAKVKIKTLTGKQINVAMLGTVPSATTAATANALAPVEAQHYIGDPGQPGFEKGSTNLPPAVPFHYGRASFYKDHDGIVHLEGAVQSGSVSGTFIFTLPPGFRPANNTLRLFEVEGLTVYVFGGNYSVEGTDFSGKVLVLGEYAVLDGITFRAES